MIRQVPKSHARPDFTETLVRPRRVYNGRIINVCADVIRLPNGKRAMREYIDHPGAVAAIPFLRDGRVVLVRQYRYPVHEETLEIPAGKLDAGESARACVARELREETGYTARRIRPLLDYWPTPAFANELLHIFVADGLTPGPLKTDEDEFLDVVVLPFSKVLAMVRSGRIRDSKTVIGLLACAQWRKFR